MLCWEKSSTFCAQSIDIDPASVYIHEETKIGKIFANNITSMKDFAGQTR